MFPQRAQALRSALVLGLESASVLGSRSVSELRSASAKESDGASVLKTELATLLETELVWAKELVKVWPWPSRWVSLSEPPWRWVSTWARLDSALGSESISRPRSRTDGQSGTILAVCPSTWGLLPAAALESAPR